jgi:hypothetical protein
VVVTPVSGERLKTLHSPVDGSQTTNAACPEPGKSVFQRSEARLAPACVTVTVAPAIVTDAVRASLAPMCGAAVSVGVALPTPEAGVRCIRSSCYLSDRFGPLAAHPRVHFHYTPTSASWLNQIEGFFGILTKQSLSVTAFTSKRALMEHPHAHLRAWNQNPDAFRMDGAGASHHQVPQAELDLISTAVR